MLIPNRIKRYYHNDSDNGAKIGITWLVGMLTMTLLPGFFRSTQIQMILFFLGMIIFFVPFSGLYYEPPTRPYHPRPSPPPRPTLPRVTSRQTEEVEENRERLILED
jgi:hypothetical protein